MPYESYKLMDQEEEEMKFSDELNNMGMADPKLEGKKIDIRQLQLSIFSDSNSKSDSGLAGESEGDGALKVDEISLSQSTERSQD